MTPPLLMARNVSAGSAAGDEQTKCFAERCQQQYQDQAHGYRHGTCHVREADDHLRVTETWRIFLDSLHRISPHHTPHTFSISTKI